MGKVKKKQVKAATKEPRKTSAAPTVKGIPWPSDVDYINLFNTCIIAKEHLGEVDNLIDKIIVPNRGRYETVANQASSPLSIFEKQNANSFLGLGNPGWMPGSNAATSLSAISSPFSAGSLLRNLPAAAPGMASLPSLPGGNSFASIGELAPNVNFLGMQSPGSSSAWDGLSSAFRLTAMAGSRIPWYVVAVIHHMEGSSNFKTHLHNGDPLTGYTVHIPAGRPKVGHPPPFTWEESAVDSLLNKEHFDKVSHWSLPTMLQRMEAYNGSGYKNRKMSSPYLWAYSNHYTKGKYIRDKVFDENAVSKQLGAGVILKRMEERAIIYIPRW